VSEILATYETTDGELMVLDAEQYDALLNDCQAIWTERGLWARLEYLAAKWQIGERIAQDPQYAKLKGGNGCESITKRLAQDIQWSPSEIYRCVQFYEQFSTLSLGDGTPEALLDAFPEDGKAISWTRVKEKYLPEHKDDKPKRHKVDKDAIERLGLDRVTQEWREEDQDRLVEMLGLNNER